MVMTVALLNAEGFQNLKYCIRSMGFLEHLEAFLYPTVHEIPCSVRCQATDTNGVRQHACGAM